jgi:gas vesicle protein
MNDRIYYSREAEMRANRDKAMAVMLFMALGLGIGAVLALLFAPKSGDKTREELGGALEDRFSRVEKEVSTIGKKVEERLKDIR